MSEVWWDFIFVICGGFNFVICGGVQFHDLPDFQFRDLRGYQFRDLRGYQFRDLRGFQFRDLRGFQFRDLRGFQFRDLQTALQGLKNMSPLLLITACLQELCVCNFSFSLIYVFLFTVYRVLNACVKRMRDCEFLRALI